MTTTEASTDQRLAALDRRRSASKRGGRRRPAEASRVLAAGAGTAAVLTMVTAMAHTDQVVEVAGSPEFETPVAGGQLTFDPGATHRPAADVVAPAQTAVIQTITVARPARSQVSNARTSASR